MTIFNLGLSAAECSCSQVVGETIEEAINNARPEYILSSGGDLIFDDDAEWYEEILADWRRQQLEVVPANVAIQPAPEAVGCNEVLGAERPGKE